MNLGDAVAMAFGLSFLLGRAIILVRGPMIAALRLRVKARKG